MISPACLNQHVRVPSQWGRPCVSTAPLLSWLTEGNWKWWLCGGRSSVLTNATHPGARGAFRGLERVMLKVVSEGSLCVPGGTPLARTAHVVRRQIRGAMLQISEPTLHPEWFIMWEHGGGGGGERESVEASPPPQQGQQKDDNTRKLWSRGAAFPAASTSALVNLAAGLFALWLVSTGVRHRETRVLTRCRNKCTMRLLCPYRRRRKGSWMVL